MSNKRLDFNDFIFQITMKEYEDGVIHEYYLYFQSGLYLKENELITTLLVEWGDELINKDGDPMESWWDYTTLFPEKICYAKEN